MKQKTELLGVAVMALGMAAAIEASKADDATDRPPAKVIVTTNWYRASENIREVNGQAYDRDRSPKWKLRGFNILDVRSDGLLARERISGFKYQQNSEGVFFLLLNYPKELAPAVGQARNYRMMNLGTTNIDGRVIELWDYGKPHLVPVVVTNKMPALKPTSGPPQTNQSGSNPPAH
jgi:hypothetical protein